MRMITRRPLAESIKMANSEFCLKKLLKFGIIACAGHFAVSYYLLSNLIPLIPFINNPNSATAFIMCACIGLYPMLLSASINKSKVNYINDVNEANQVIDEVAEDMNMMGIDVSKENLLEASIQLEQHDEKFLGMEGLRVYNQAIIKIHNKKQQLMVLRECSTMIQVFTYARPVPDILVHLLDEDEYQEEDVNKRQLNI